MIQYRSISTNCHMVLILCPVLDTLCNQMPIIKTPATWPYHQEIIQLISNQMIPKPTVHPIINSQWQDQLLANSEITATHHIPWSRPRCTPDSVRCSLHMYLDNFHMDNCIVIIQFHLPSNVELLKIHFAPTLHPNQWHPIPNGPHCAISIMSWVSISKKPLARSSWAPLQ